MKESYFLNENKLLKEAIQALIDRLGPVETNRFLSLPVQKRIESVKRHHLWQSTLDKEKFFREMFEPPHNLSRRLSRLGLAKTDRD